MLGKKREEKPLIAPPNDASMADKAEYAWNVIRRDIEAEAEKSGKPLGFSEKLVLNSMQDMLPAIFEMAEDQAKIYGEKIYELMSYVLGYSDAPVQTNIKAQIEADLAKDTADPEKKD